MVTSRLNELFQCLDTKNGQIAKLAGFDRTNISRLRSAGRTPEKNSPTIRKLVLGLYLYADNQNELGKLCEYIGAKPDGTAEEIMEMLRDWLYEGEPEKEEKAAGSPQRPNSARKQRPAYRFFGERLDALMKLTDLSNVRLSHAIHMDSSMISRFRTGVRTPVPGSDVMHRIPAVLFERAEAAGKLPALAKLINYPASMVDEEALRAWLFDDGQMPERNAGIAENLLGIFDFCRNRSCASPAGGCRTGGRRIVRSGCVFWKRRDPQCCPPVSAHCVERESRASALIFRRRPGLADRRPGVSHTMGFPDERLRQERDPDPDHTQH